MNLLDAACGIVGTTPAIPAMVPSSSPAFVVDDDVTPVKSGSSDVDAVIDFDNIFEDDNAEGHQALDMPPLNEQFSASTFEWALDCF